MEQDSPWWRESRTETTRDHFRRMSFFFSAHHGCVVACLSLATARLGSNTGNIQSFLLYVGYTGSALLGATYVTKKAGPQRTLVLGLTLYGMYVLAFWGATSIHNILWRQYIAWTGALFGGIGGGVLWTAQGAFFAQSAEGEEATAQLSSEFAVIYLTLELVIRSLSTLLLAQLGWSWKAVFAVYSLVAIVSTLGMALAVQDPSPQGNNMEAEEVEPNEIESENAGEDMDAQQTVTPIRSTGLISNHSQNEENDWYKITAALQLLRHDARMPFLIGLTSVFGFAASLLNSYVNGHVVHVALPQGDYNIGILNALVSAMAALVSFFVGRYPSSKGPVLTLGAICFFLIASALVLIAPERWSWAMLIVLYSLHGTGRAAFESPLKALFADWFAHEHEGAFANIILQNGIASAVGYVVNSWPCSDQATHSRSCVQYVDGTFHRVGVLESMVMVTSVVAVIGYWYASIVHQRLVATAEENSVQSNGHYRDIPE